MKPVTVAAYNSLTEAQALKDRLAAAGISAELRSEASADPSLEFSRVGVGVHVTVARAQFDDALRLVYDWNSKKEGDSGRPVQGADRPSDPAAPRIGGGTA